MMMIRKTMIQMMMMMMMVQMMMSGTNVVNIREVFENTYQGQPSLLVVMEW